MKWVVVVTAPDGTKSVAGPFGSEYAATVWGNDHETMDSGMVCDVCPLESPAAWEES